MYTDNHAGDYTGDPSSDIFTIEVIHIDDITGPQGNTGGTGDPGVTGGT